MKWFRRGRHRANKYSLRVADLQPEPVTAPLYSLAELFDLHNQIWERRPA